MKSKLLLLILIAAATLVLTVSLAAQSATMSAPIVRTAEGQVIFTVRVENLEEGNQYRLGLGFPTDTAPEATVELSIEDSPVNLSPASFAQDNTSNWWGVSKLASRGFNLTPSDLPRQGEALTFRASVPKDTADQFEKLFIFISRDYGSNTWYLIDGSELSNSYW